MPKCVHKLIHKFTTDSSVGILLNKPKLKCSYFSYLKTFKALQHKSTFCKLLKSLNVLQYSNKKKTERKHKKRVKKNTIIVLHNNK